MPSHRKNSQAVGFESDNALRNARGGLTQTAAAKLAGVSRSLWSFWECRKRPMSLAQLNRIAIALDLDDKVINGIRTWWGFHDGEPETGLPVDLETKILQRMDVRQREQMEAEKAAKARRVKEAKEAKEAAKEAAKAAYVAAQKAFSLAKAKKAKEVARAKKAAKAIKAKAKAKGIAKVKGVAKAKKGRVTVEAAKASQAAA